MAGFNDWLEVTDPTLMAETIAERFRLSQNELQKAQEALAPAFALGFQRAMATPAAWSGLAGAFSAMGPGLGASPATIPGQAFLDAFFGSDALTGAVARQASLFAGIAPDTIQKLMPSLAMLSMETMVRGAMGAIQRNQPPGLATGDFGGATAEMMRRGANAVEALSRPSDAPGARVSPAAAFAAGNPFADAFAQAMTTSLSWMQGLSSGPAPRPEPPREAPPSPESFNPMMPFAAMFDAFARGMRGDETEPAQDENARRRDQSSPIVTPPADRASAIPEREGGSGTIPAENIVGDLLRSGQRFQEDYAQEMASLFDRYQGAAS